MNLKLKKADQYRQWLGFWPLIAALALVSCKPHSPAEELTLYQQGQREARLCTGCHGVNGISKVLSYPSIAGLSEQYIGTELLRFKGGARVNPLMNSVAKSLTEEQIQSLAAFYSAQPASVR